MTTTGRPFPTWLSRSSRRRLYVKWLATCCILGAGGFIFSTSGLPTKADQETKRRHADAAQAFVQSEEPSHRLDPIAEPVRVATKHVTTNPKQETQPTVDLYSSAARQTAFQSIEAFPSYEKYLALVEQAGDLPDHVYVPFEDASFIKVSEDLLVGWEAEWLTNATYDSNRWGPLQEPRIDFVYTWVNGSEEAFRNTKHPYELNSTLNDHDGVWLGRHGANRYRDWNELKYSIRSVEKNAPFTNKIQILVNSLGHGSGAPTKQTPVWLDHDKIGSKLEVLSQEDFFEADKQGCLPTFNSLTMENQIFGTDSNVDRLFALSDDMLLGKKHAASDVYSPLFGPMLAFKPNAYNTLHPPSELDANRFGEKPWLVYTSWLLNRRFGARKRKGQAHFGHSLSRKLTREAIRSFPGPELQSACSRFRGDFGFQLYSWYATFHYTMERHREALLWGYLIHRSDPDQDGYLSWQERQQVLQDLTEGLRHEQQSSYRARNFYHVSEMLEGAGLHPPKVNVDMLWTSLDGPLMIKDLDCFSFDVNDCLASGFSIYNPYQQQQSPVFSTAAMLDRVARQQPECGDCMIKILLHRARKGLAPLMPKAAEQPKAFETVVKALMRYQYTVHEPDGMFVMVTDAEQVESMLSRRLLNQKTKVGQLCLNDDVATNDEQELQNLHVALNNLFEGLFPKPSRYEL